MSGRRAGGALLDRPVSGEQKPAGQGRPAETGGYRIGLDGMCLLAALLVITIPTSPLAGYSAVGDFILTRVLARVAVPFFLMTAGYFTLSRYREDNRKLVVFLKKTAILYGAAVVLYLPMNLYGGDFRRPDFLPRLLRDFAFDGTVYHLWYFPASMLGMLLAWQLRRLRDAGGMAVAGLLYLIGLLGDSYYGLIVGIPALRCLYAQLFALFAYTRNGLFYAPLFLMLGSLAADTKRRLSRKQAGLGLGVSLLLMLAEALLLRRSGWQRHDSMYVFLPLCTVFLFRLVLSFRGNKIPLLRPMAPVIYLIHPMMIVAVRGAARALHLQHLLVENSLVYFAAVCLLSVLFAGAAASLWLRRSGGRQHCKQTERAYVEINLSNLSHNAAVLQAAMPRGCKLMAVVKTEAYGHGAYAVATRLEQDGVTAFAVATVDEGIRLRRYGIRGSILILGYTDVHRAGDLRKFRLTQTLIDGNYADRLNRQGIPVRVHIGIDSGMHRLGMDVEDFEAVRQVFRMKNLRVEGMFTHLCCCDSLAPEDVRYTEDQIQRFYGLIDRMKENGLPVPKLHIQSSYGLLNYPALQCDYVREGISLYGVASAAGDRTRWQPDLRPVLALKARVALIRNVPKGAFVGYGRAFRAERDSRIAILPIGYGDGYPRALSGGKTRVRIGDDLVPVIGRICMDQMAVDITDTEGIAVGDTATLIDNQADSPLLAPEVAAQSGSISNELLSRMGPRLPVVVQP